MCGSIGWFTGLIWVVVVFSALHHLSSAMSTLKQHVDAWLAKKCGVTVTMNLWCLQMKTVCLIHQPGLVVLHGITRSQACHFNDSNISNSTVPLYNQFWTDPGLPRSDLSDMDDHIFIPPSLLASNTHRFSSLALIFTPKRWYRHIHQPFTRVHQVSPGFTAAHRRSLRFLCPMNTPII